MQPVQNPSPNHSSNPTASKENLISQLSKFKAHLAALEKAGKECDEYIDMMGIEKARPKSNLNKQIGAQLSSYMPEAPLSDLISQIEQFRLHLKEREEYLQADLAYLKKETGIEVPSPPSFFQNQTNPETPGAKSSVKKEKTEERKLDEKDIQKKKHELTQENKKIHEEIIEFKDLIELMTDKAKEVGNITALNNNASDNLESFINTNKLLRDQLHLCAKILTEAGIEQKIKSISCPEPEKPVGTVPKEVTNQTPPKQGHWSEGKLEGIPPQNPTKHVYKPLKPPVRDGKGQIILEKPVLFTLKGDIFEEKTLRIDLEYYSGVPQPDKKLGDPTKINDVKAEITPYANVWRSTVRNLISRYELVDIDRGNYGRKRAIIKYRDRDDKDETHGVFPVFSRAYFKLWEVLDITGILDKYKEKPINIASLAEGPGGFIHCMIDWRKKQNGADWNKDSYSAITLRNLDGKLDHECLDWDAEANYSYWKYAKGKYSINLSYGKGEKEATGDLLQKENLQHFKDVDLKGQKCALVTADGGIHLEGDDSYSLQEVANIKLFFAEALYALNVQELGGSFVMKIYDIYFEITVELILLLAFYYEKITIFKPLTSRPANSEKYVIAEGFKGISDDHLERLDDLFFGELFAEEKNKDYLKNKMFAQRIFDFDVYEEKLKKWKQDLAKGNEMHMKAQVEAIEYGLGIASVNFASVDKKFLTQKRNEQKEFCIAWCQRHGIPYIEDFRV